MLTVDERRHQEDLQRLRDLRLMDDDFFSLGKPVYPIERVNLVTGKPFDDGAHILYVNGECREDSELGRLMHDFNCTNAKDMYFALLAERTRYLKEHPKGVTEICKLMEDMREESMREGMREGMKRVALRMLAAGNYALEEIADISGLPYEEVSQLKKQA